MKRRWDRTRRGKGKKKKKKTGGEQRQRRTPTAEKRLCRVLVDAQTLRLYEISVGVTPGRGRCCRRITCSGSA